MKKILGAKNVHSDVEMLKTYYKETKLPKIEKEKFESYKKMLYSLLDPNSFKNAIFSTELASEKHAGWTILCSIHKDSSPYYQDKFWSNEITLRDHEANEDTFTNTSKHKPFFQLPVEYLLLVHESGRDVVLKLPKRAPL